VVNERYVAKKDFMKSTSTVDSEVSFTINRFKVALARIGSAAFKRARLAFSGNACWLDELESLGADMEAMESVSLGGFFPLPGEFEDEGAALRPSVMELWAFECTKLRDELELGGEEAALPTECSLSNSEPFKNLKLPSSGSNQILIVSGYWTSTPTTVRVCIFRLGETGGETAEYPVLLNELAAAREPSGREEMGECEDELGDWELVLGATKEGELLSALGDTGSSRDFTDLRHWSESGPPPVEADNGDREPEEGESFRVDSLLPEFAANLAGDDMGKAEVEDVRSVARRGISTPEWLGRNFPDQVVKLPEAVPCDALLEWVVEPTGSEFERDWLDEGPE